MASPALPRAWADATDADRATARELGQTGLEALERKEYARAADLLTRADRLYRAPTIELGLARAQSAIGKLVAARETYTRLIREPLSPSSPEAFRAAVEAGRVELSALNPRISFVTLNVDGPKEPALTLDGETVSSSVLGVRRPVDSGRHMLKVMAPGYVAATREFSLKEGETLDVRLTMTSAPVDAAAPVASALGASEPMAAPTTAAAEPKKPSQQPLYGVVVLGVGGAALATGVITGLLAMGKKNSLDEACPNKQCPPAAQSDYDSFSTLRTVSTVGFVAGLVGIGAGVTLLLTSPSAPKQTVGIAPILGPGYLGVNGIFLKIFIR